MTEELKQAIALLRQGAPSINKAADEATKAVRAAERLLEECGAGVNVSVGVSESAGEGEDTRRYLELGYERCESKYRIVIINELGAGAFDNQFDQFEYSHPLDRSVTPWMEAPRSDKLATFSKLPSLLTKVARAVTDQLKDVEEAAKASRELFDAMAPKIEVEYAMLLSCVSNSSVTGSVDPGTGYLNRHTGEIVWVNSDLAKAEEIGGKERRRQVAKNAKRVKSEPDQWIEIPQVVGPNDDCDEMLDKLFREHELIVELV